MRAHLRRALLVVTATTATALLPVNPAEAETVSVAKINFQPAGAPVPSGYVADTGAVYADRGGGQSFGWSAVNTANARDRGVAADQRYDTLNHMQRNGTFSWEIAVANGSYTVRIVAGDPSYSDSAYRIAAEGVLTVSGTPTSSAKFVEGTRTVTVSDGRLTVSSATGASNNKLAFLEVTTDGPAPPPPPPPPPPPSGPCYDISPLPCAQVRVSTPYQLGFAGDAGKLADQAGIGTGFTMVDPPTKGAGYLPAKLKVNTAAPGTLEVTTTGGLAYLGTNSLDNALGVGVDAANQISVVGTTLRNVPTGTGAYEQAGLWFGLDEDNHVKLTVQSIPGGSRIEFLKEVNGQAVSTARTGTLALTGSNVALTLRADPGAQSISASYRINAGTTTNLATWSLPGAFFNSDGAGIDPTLGTRVFAGILASHRNATTPLVYSFDDFSLTGTAPPPPPPPAGISFVRSSIPIPNPTSMTWGPDGRLYVSELLGNIHALTLGADKKLVSDQVVTTLGYRLTLGLAIDPASTASNVILWAAHSDPNLSNSAAENSTVVSKLSGPGLGTRLDVITGLPRSKANHSVNSIHFGPDGKLYLAAGGNTGAGAPSEVPGQFGDRPEQALSAAILVADVKNASFDGTCALAVGAFGPAPCSVVPHATGFRNSYDFVFHTNGYMYATDNGLGVDGTYPPSPTAPCTGLASSTLHAPGDQPDLLHRVQAGKYYGHPNPYRNECVFKNGSYQQVAAPANYVAPMYAIGPKTSSNGLIEYRGNGFNGSLKGRLMWVNYSQGDNLMAAQLSADGKSVVNATSIATGFSDPLPMAQGPDGTIYVGEFAGGKVTALVPAS